jgi:cytochrome c-type protein NapB
MLTLASIMIAAGVPALAQELTTLRGADPVDELPQSGESEPLKASRSAMSREFEQQPPLIPHSIKAYTINLKANKCLNCHREGKAGKKPAPKVSESHFMNRDGEKLADVSASRYFCTQCHVEQFETPPLVENEFEPLASKP